MNTNDHAYALWQRDYGEYPNEEQRRMLDLVLAGHGSIWVGTRNRDKQRALLIAAKAMSGGKETR